MSRDESDHARECFSAGLPSVAKQHAVLEWIAECVCFAGYGAAACEDDLEVVLVRVVTQAAQHGIVLVGSAVPDSFGEAVNQPEEDEDDRQGDQVSQAAPKIVFHVVAVRCQA